MSRKESNMKPYVLVAASLAALAPIQAYANPTTIQFDLTVSAGAKACLPKAHGTVTDHTFGEFENLEVVVYSLPPNTDFDLFSIEVPNAPFGLAWYIGDINTDATGTGVGNFVGRFNVETSIRRMTPKKQAVRVPTPRSTGNITPAFRSSTRQTSPIPRVRCST
jgi:hypothetical protein